MFQQKIKKLAIIMDEIDCMNTGDKGGISALIKMIRPKKTKKQKTEDFPRAALRRPALVLDVPRLRF